MKREFQGPPMRKWKQYAIEKLDDVDNYVTDLPDKTGFDPLVVFQPVALSARFGAWILK